MYNWWIHGRGCGDLDGGGSRRRCPQTSGVQTICGIYFIMHHEMEDLFAASSDVWIFKKSRMVTEKVRLVQIIF